MTMVHWQRLLADTLAAEGEVVVINAVCGALQRKPTRAELVAAHRAARALVATGKAVAGRVTDDRINAPHGMFVVLVPAGQIPPRAMSQQALGQSVGWSQSTVSRRVRHLKRDWLQLLPA